ncbi:hypothetical protein Mal48_43890 [Thalassoglobus polymorphus]|uniref:Uncharacterized protein n=1 Tax=Thalassoglobus polymorphus TaxID=2527994 RepID=A0A517QTZ2_9PLAN|nr:hypothetical protein Mal48_43890 [Thalassoglobus polymorphus]
MGMLTKKSSGIARKEDSHFQGDIQDLIQLRMATYSSLIGLLLINVDELVGVQQNVADVD